MTLAPPEFAIPAPRDDVPTANEFARDRRRELVAPTWREVPRHQLHWRMAPEFLAAVDAWSADRSLVLLGVTGTGKTSAAVRLVARLCKLAVDQGGDHLARARSLCWVDADDLTDAGGSREDDAREVIRRATEARVLVLDDVAEGSKTLRRVLRGRLRRRVPTLLTSGMTTTAQLARAIGGEAVLRHVLDATGTPGRVIVAHTVPRPT
jgi:hypothetical protein